MRLKVVALGLAILLCRGFTNVLELADVGEISNGYLLAYFSTVVAIFLVLSLAGTYSQQSLLMAGTGISIAVAFSDVVTDKLMIDRGKAINQTAWLQSAQWAGLGFSAMVMLLLGGWLADNATLSTVFGLSMIVPGLALVIVAWVLREPRSSQTNNSWKVTWQGMVHCMRDRQFLMLLGLIMLLGLSPAPPTYFYERDVLRFSNELIGQLGAWSALGMGVGALGFRWLSHWLSGKWLLHGVIGLNVVAGLSYLFLHDQSSAIGVYLFGGVGRILATLCMFELLVPYCVVGAEATIYAVALATSNLARSIGGLLGGILYDRGISFPILILIGAGMTACCWLLLPVLQRQEGENSF